jgi:dihydropteroate synthase
MSDGKACAAGGGGAAGRVAGAPGPMARVVAWPHPGVSGDGIYSVQVTGVARGAARFTAAAHEAGLWVASGGHEDAVIVSGPADRVRAFAERDGSEPAVAVAQALLSFAALPETLVAAGRVLDLRPGPLVVGILNATPDSFYDHGRYFALDAARRRADEMVSEGVDLIEVGGESARPGVPISEDEEIRRVVPVLEMLAGRLPVPTAVDTYKPGVARRAVEAGAVLINDISGLHDPAMAEVAAETRAALVVMHIRGRPKIRQLDLRYGAVVDEVYEFLRARTDGARRAGVPASQLVIDPGFSFGKAAHHDLEILRRLGEFRSLGYPIYLATSRKNYIRDVLRLPFEELLEGTAAAIAYGVAQGAQLVRTHDVGFMRRIVSMTRMIVRSTGGGAAGLARNDGASRR